MINVNLRGRIGNQLFIYAFVRQLQEKSNQTIVINQVMQSKEFPDFKLELDQFNISDNVSIENEKGFPFYYSNDFILLKLLRKLFPRFIYSVLEKKNVFLWLEDTCVAIDYDASKDAYIDGFWQSENYFKDIRKILLQEITPRKPISGSNLELLNKIEKFQSVCITIRRGDYVSNPKIKNSYYVCDKKYFDKAIEKMSELVPGCNWFVFSDDVAWVKENYVFPGEVYFEKGDDSVATKLCLMSHCKHFIISNSSFSWWAQYLGVYDNKKVIAPSKWYSDGRKCDIYQKNWILIEV